MSRSTASEDFCGPQRRAAPVLSGILVLISQRSPRMLELRPMSDTFAEESDVDWSSGGLSEAQTAPLCCIMLGSFGAAWRPTHGSLQPAICLDLATALYGTRRAYNNLPNTHAHSSFSGLLLFCRVLSVFRTLLLTQCFSFPLPILDLNHSSGVIILFDHGLSSLDSSLSALSRSKSSTQDSVCFQACGVNVSKSR